MAKPRHTLAQMTGLAVLWAAAACDDGGEPSSPDRSSEAKAAIVTASELDGREFALESAESFSPVPGHDVRLSFRDGELSLNAGCNARFGRYELQEGHVVVSRLASTTKDCPADLQAQDEWLAKFIAKQPLVTISGVRVTLAAESSALVFVERKSASDSGTNDGTPGVGSSTPK